MIARSRAGVDSLARTSAWLPLTWMVGAATLTAFSTLQKLQMGVPLTVIGGYFVPVLFGGFGGLALGYVYRKRAHDLESLREEIDARKAKERELERYRLAVESSTNLLAGLDPEYTLLFANRAYRAFHGLSPEEDVSEYTLEDVVVEADVEAVKPYVDRALAGESCEFEIVREGVDDEEREFVVRNYPLEDDGEITGVVSAMNDVTERRERRREIVAQKNRYESLFDSIRDAIVVVDGEGAIENANPGFTALFGYEFSDVAGEDVSILYAEDAAFDVATAMDGAVSTGMSETKRYRKRSGQVFEGEERIFPVREPGEGITDYVTIVRDVSGRETRLQQLQVLERVFRHNINNDMNVIAGYAETIRDVATEPVSEYAETILEKSEALVDTAEKERQITAHLSRSPSSEHTELHSKVRETVEWARERYSEAEIATNLPDGCETSAPDGIGTAIEELVENAIAHSDREEPSIRVSMEVGEDVVDVIVADDGPGIPQMERSVLTDGADIDPLYHGSGLGLWLVNLIVRQSDGVLRFEENDPRGSVVTISLPRQAPETVVESSESLQG